MQVILLRLVITILALFGVWGVARISMNHWTGETACPMMGQVPICYIILIGYSLIVLSMYPQLKKAAIVFLLGWLPVMLFALTGVIGELTNTFQCPQTPTGIPACYFSAAFSLVIGVLSLLVFRKNLQYKFS